MGYIAVKLKRGWNLRSNVAVTGDQEVGREAARPIGRPR